MVCLFVFILNYFSSMCNNDASIVFHVKENRKHMMLNIIVKNNTDVPLLITPMEYIPKTVYFLIVKMDI
jgi:hypothetical protein